jgi:hypothetical protein
MLMAMTNVIYSYLKGVAFLQLVVPQGLEMEYLLL